MPETAETPRRRLTGAVIPALAAAALAGIGAMVIVGLNQRTAPAAQATPENCILSGIEEVGGPISLVDANGAPVTQADFTGSPAVVYFGFTHCPDVCPTALFALEQALETGAHDVQTVFISVDPDRDTPAVVGAYVQTDGFPAGLVGLTGSREQIDAAKTAFRVYASRAAAEGEDPNVYNVDHTSLAYVLDGQWRVRAIVRTPGATPEQFAQCIAAGLGEAP
jgi:protein SCO1/2